MIDRKLRCGALVALLGFLGCSSYDATTSSPAPAKPGVAAESIKTFAVAHKNAKLDAPAFVWLTRSDWPAFESADQAARAVLRTVAPTFKLNTASLASVQAPVIHDNALGPIVAKYAQRVNGVEVFRGGLNVVMTRSFEPVAATGLLASRIDGSERPFKLNGENAISVAHKAMTGAELAVAKLDAQDEYSRFTAAGLESPARTKKVFFQTKSGLEPAWYVELSLQDGRMHSYVVSAATGRVLFKNDLVRYDAYSYRVWADPTTKLPYDGPQGNGAAPHPTGLPDGWKPTFGPGQLVTLENYPFSKNDPWLPPGATTTIGNNVQAYSDVVKPNGLSPNTNDTTSTSTAANTFDYAFDFSTTAGGSATNTKAAITHMFYLVNFLHDWYYDAGFDEKSGNHQANNFGRGGKDKDALNAETEDYSGRNNANAATPSDGASPRIQMYIFSGPTNASLNVTAPAPIAGVKSVGTAGEFGKDSFTLNGQVVLANDGTGADANDACEALSGVTDKIVLVHRGNCSFVQKAQNVQKAGGTGIIITNVASSSSPNTPPFMGGTASDVNIPALSLAMADGQALEQAIASGVTVTMQRDIAHDLDGAMDTAVVSHEWGHVLSNRLVADGNGLDTNQAGGLGEGWGDFSAQMVMVKEDDIQVANNANWNGVYPSGAYAMSGGGSDFYYGIRRVPYSTDMKKNPLTFKHIADGNPLPNDVPVSFGEDGSFNSEVHNTGEVWATMLWECYASLLRDSRFTFAQAQDRMKKYLVASLKLTPPSPTLLQARDAVLAAAYATDPKDFELFWKAFAKRGAGIGAVGPEADSSDNNPVKESFDVGNDLQVLAATLKDDVISCDHDGILDEGEVGTIEITVRNSGMGALAATTAQLTSKTQGVQFADGGVVKFDAMKPFESKDAKIKAFIKGAPAVTPIDVDVAVTDPTLLQSKVVHVTVPARYNADEAPDTSAIDHVDTNGTSWLATGEDQFGTSQKWKRVREGAEQFWYIPNAGEPSDHMLTSPKFTINGSAFSLSFRHKWDFEHQDRDNTDYDGGVIEVSVDEGKTWKDISEYGQVDYNTTLSNDQQTTQALKGRKAYGHTSPGYPDKWVNSKIALTFQEAPANVMIRFRVGTDDNAGADGWFIDDITLEGATSNPFWSIVPHRDQCDPNGPLANAGPGKTVPPKAHVDLAGSATHPKNLPLTYMWTQVAGPEVKLNGADTTKLSFDAPDTQDPVTLTFALRAHDGALLSAASKVDVIVKKDDGTAPSGNGDSSGGCGCRTTPSPSNGLSTLGLAGLVFGLVRRRRNRS